MADSTPGPTSYPGQRTKTLYAEKLRYRGRRRKQQPRSGPNHKRILLWAVMLVILLLLLRLL